MLIIQTSWSMWTKKVQIRLSLVSNQEQKLRLTRKRKNFRRVLIPKSKTPNLVRQLRFKMKYFSCSRVWWRIVYLLSIKTTKIYPVMMNKPKWNITLPINSKRWFKAIRKDLEMLEMWAVLKRNSQRMNKTEIKTCFFLQFLWQDAPTP